MPRMDKLSNYRTTIIEDQYGGQVTYCSTAILVWGKRDVILSSGGWRTVTTKRKMNQASNQFGIGYGVYQRKGEWFVSWKGQELPFHDGMILAR